MPSRNVIAAMIRPIYLFGQEVVGESTYIENLWRLAGHPEGVELSYHSIASLYLEDENPYGSEAVRIDIHGLPVGYLPSAKAKKYRKLMRKRGLGYITLACAARIRGGWIKEETGIPLNYSVTLDLDDWFGSNEWEPYPVPGRVFQPAAIYAGRWPNE